MPPRNADYIDLTAGPRLFEQSLSPDRRLPEFHLWPPVREGASTRGGQSAARAAYPHSSRVQGYLNDYGFESIFSINGDTQHQVSEKVSLFGSAGLNGDLAGQLSNRFLYVPPLAVVPDPNLPPPPVTVNDPDVFSFTGRQYRIYGQAGASFTVSQRGNLTVSGGAQRTIYKNDLLNDFTDIFANGSYNHTLSERTTVGFRVGASRTEYQNSSASSTIINPALTVRTLLSEEWDASAAVGISFSDVEGTARRKRQYDQSVAGRLDLPEPGDRSILRPRLALRPEFLESGDRHHHVRWA
jgi:hypothetical protein